METSKLIREGKHKLEALDIDPGDETGIPLYHLARWARECLPEILTRLERYEAALKKIRDCDWVISLPDRMNAVRDIAKEALNTKDTK